MIKKCLIYISCLIFSFKTHITNQQNNSLILINEHKNIPINTKTTKKKKKILSLQKQLRRYFKKKIKQYSLILKKKFIIIRFKAKEFIKYLFNYHLKLIIIVAVIYICIYLLRFYPGINIRKFFCLEYEDH